MELDWKLDWGLIGVGVIKQQKCTRTSKHSEYIQGGGGVKPPKPPLGMPMRVHLIYTPVSESRQRDGGVGFVIGSYLAPFCVRNPKNNDLHYLCRINFERKSRYNILD